MQLWTSFIEFWFQLSGGKKPKKGPFNGYAKISIAQPENKEKYYYGLRNKKCIQVYSDMVSQISGKFVNDVIEGDVAIHFIDKKVMKGKNLRITELLHDYYSVNTIKSCNVFSPSIAP